MLETLQKIAPTDKVKMDDTGRQSAGNEHLQWLAGFLDGEGCFMLAYRKDQGRYHPMVTINNTHKPTIERISTILREIGTAHWMNRTDHKGRNHKPNFTIEISGMKRVQRFLPFILPYLFTKRHQGELLFDYVNVRMGGAIRTPLGEKEHSLYAALKQANRFGSSETTRAPLENVYSREDIVRLP